MTDEDLIATARRAKGSAVLPTVSFGAMNAEALILRMADRIEALEAELAMAVEAGVDVAASLSAAISLLQRGGKKAAPSDKMFNQMLADYNASLDRLRTTLAEPTGGKNAKSDM